MRHLLHIALLAGLTPLALLACGEAASDAESDAGPTPPSAPPTSSVPEVRADADRDETRPLTDTALGAVVAGQNTFGLEFYRALAASEAGNLFCSSLSAHQALSMAYAGARGETRAAMAGTLHAVDDDEAYHGAQNTLAQAVLAPPSEGSLPEGEPAPLLRLQNALFPQEGFAIDGAYLERLAKSYGAGAFPVDYRHDAEAARGTINTWVSEVTAGRIPELLVPGQVGEGTVLTLVNAVYFLGKWSEAFLPESTFEQTFHTASGDADVAFMHHTFESLSAAITPEFTAVSLPYAGGELSFLALQPVGDLRAFEDSLTDATLAGALAALTLAPTQLAMPSFELRSRYSLKPMLETLGMGVAFSDAADFHGICPDFDLKISEVVQEAWVKVDESGTEAAAATAIVFDAGAAPEPEPIRSVSLDRPFVFVIRHEPTGAVIFMGRVADPR